jgi:hypothetical protein
LKAFEPVRDPPPLSARSAETYARVELFGGSSNSKIARLIETASRFRDVCNPTTGV